MRVPSVRAGRLGAAAVTVADCDPAGNIMLNPTTVVSGGSVNVSRHVVNVAGCNPAIISEAGRGPVRPRSSCRCTSGEYPSPG